LSDDTRENLASDILEGAESIAAFLGKDPRQVYHMASRGQLPTFKLGSVLHARRSTLRQFIEEREAGAVVGRKNRLPGKSE
jgi:hypothetical protein